MSRVLDWFNLMTYDFSGAWSKQTNFNAPLYRAKEDPFPANNVDAAVRAYLQAGVPPHQITLGMPFYGRGWANVGQTNDGLYQRTTKLAQGSFGGSAYTYKDLIENYIEQKDYARHWNDEAKVPWLYSHTDRVFITYEDPESIGFKADYVADHALGGAMALATDSVDPEQIERPRRWEVRFIVRFMMSFGFSSSMFDFLTFGAMFYVFSEMRTAGNAEAFEQFKAANQPVPSAA